jgi:hypothetical protein
MADSLPKPTLLATVWVIRLPITKVWRVDTVFPLPMARDSMAVFVITLLLPKTPALSVVMLL